jgi:hypothetical protein
MHSRGFGAQLLCSDEIRIQHFHDWYGEWLGAK